MYGYSEFVPLTVEEILKRVPQEKIFELAIGKSPAVYDYLKSPFRSDRRPGCFFSYYSNKLYFVDFADKVTHRDCFAFIKDYYRLSFPQTLQFINNKLNIGLDGYSSLPEKFTIKHYKEKPRIHRDIEFYPTYFTISDRDFWSPYGITKTNLEDDKVFAVRWYKFFSNKSNEWVTIRPNSLCYAFIIGNKTKIYTPFATRLKFVSNATENDIGFIDELPSYGDQLIITKGYKDARVLRNEKLNVVWTQGEGMKPKDEIITNLGKRFNRIVILYDNDEPGLVGSVKLSQIINSHFPGKSVPMAVPKFDGVKDPSDLRMVKGRDELLLFLLKNRIL